MEEPEGPAGKEEALGADGTLNPHPERVTDVLFRANAFFDAHDLVQVKYEMVRRVQCDGLSVTAATSAFGFSRPVFYQAQQALAREGLPGLIPRRPGPRGGHKLSGAVLAFVEALLAEEGPLRAVELARRIEERFGTRVHPRSVERALVRRQKGGRPTV